jgi:hypothetical protein
MLYKVFKGIILCLLVTILLAGCTSTSTGSLKLDMITGDRFTEVCHTPGEYYNIPIWRLGIPAKVVRHSNCMGINDMLIVIHPAPGNELTSTASRLLAMMYVDSKTKDDKNPENLKASYLKTQTTVAGGNVVYLVFFELTKIPKG